MKYFLPFFNRNGVIFFIKLRYYCLYLSGPRLNLSYWNIASLLPRGLFLVHVLHCCFACKEEKDLPGQSDKKKQKDSFSD